MARTVGMDSLEQKIEKAKEKVVRAKAIHAEAVDELQKLLDKKTALQTDEIMRAIANSNKSHKEILQFISST